MTTSIPVSAYVPNIEDIWDCYQNSIESLEFKKDLILSALRGDVDVTLLAKHGITLDPLTTSTEVTDLFSNTVTELENLVKLNLLSAVEGHVRYDFAIRINNSRTDPLSICFKNLFFSAKNQAKKVQFQGGQGILAAWDKHLTNSWKWALLKNFEDILELRHWLAHGRWWQLEPAVNLPVSEIKDIVDNALDAMSLP
ncbi:MAG: hypothetical protein HW380_1608 [Magnetococcales bacterium]|nr:hypothetical protein [Magnetococcales bacterium]HIJ85165.1 hypothetical protein [Magnetococcales bacterium]